MDSTISRKSNPLMPSLDVEKMEKLAVQRKAMDKKVEKVTVNLTVPLENLTRTDSTIPGYEFESKARIKLFMYKGNSISRQEHVMLNRLLMFRLQLKLEGKLANYMPLPYMMVKETVQNVDIDFTLLDMFFRRKHTKWKVLKLLGPIREKYFGTKIGEYIGTVFMDYYEFMDFTNYITFLSHEPIKDEKVF